MNENKEYGLVLAGGGTKGAYQLGAYKALKELNIKITCIVGASIGGLNGALILQDNLEQMENLYKEIKITDILKIEKEIDTNKNIFDMKNLYALITQYYQDNGIDNGPLRELVNKYIDIDKIYKSDIDFGIITYSIKDRTARQVFKNDIKPEELIDYLLASACFPIFKPQKIDDEEFFDGGLYDNVPVNMLIEKGYKNIIVLDIAGTGYRRKNLSRDVYVKIINSSNIQGGVFEFNQETIQYNIRLGYLDTLRAFNKIQGHIYAFKTSEFCEFLEEFNLQVIYGLECVAEMYGMDKLKIYTREEFLEELLKRHREAENVYNKLKETIDIKKILKSSKEILSVLNSGVGTCFVLDMVKSRPKLRIDKFIDKNLKKYKYVIEGMLEFLNSLK